MASGMEGSQEIQKMERMKQLIKAGNIKIKNKKRNGRIAIYIFLTLLTVYFSVAVFFNSHFQFGTTVNGNIASGITVKEAEDMIAAGVEEYEISIKSREGKEERIKGSEINLKPVFDDSLQKELKRQNKFFWPLSFLRSDPVEVEAMVSFDKESLKKSVADLEVMDKSKMKSPQNATVSEYDEKDGYQIIPEKEGTAVDEGKFLEVLEKAVLSLSDHIVMEKEGCYIEPEYTKDSKEIVELAETMNKYVKASVTYEFGENHETLDGKTISQWITVDKNQKAVLSQEEVEKYIDALADQYNTAGKPKHLTSSYGSTVTIYGGNYGWKIDQEKEAEALSRHIKNGEIISKEPEYSQRAGSRGANDYGGTYVEVNLTAQHLYYYKNGTLILETDFVSGNEARGWDTPAGAYGLYYKETDRILRGEDYATPVSFWMPFNGGVGFHDANWRSDFGGNYYKRNGSHGCVNMPSNAAKKLYDNIEPGCAVLVYQLAGTESSKAKAQDAAATVVQTIQALGEVTLDKRGAVENARNQYNNLSGEAKRYVTNYQVLESAENKIRELEAEMTAKQQAEEEKKPDVDETSLLKDDNPGEPEE